MVMFILRREVKIFFNTYAFRRLQRTQQQIRNFRNIVVSIEIWLNLKEQQKSKILEESMRKLDAEMRRTDSLLYQMIPKPVADRLRRGEPAITTCQASTFLQ